MKDKGCGPEMAEIGLSPLSKIIFATLLMVIGVLLSMVIQHFTGWDLSPVNIAFSLIWVFCLIWWGFELAFTQKH